LKTLQQNQEMLNTTCNDNSWSTNGGLAVDNQTSFWQ